MFENLNNIDITHFIYFSVGFIAGNIVNKCKRKRTINKIKNKQKEVVNVDEYTDGESTEEDTEEDIEEYSDDFEMFSDTEQDIVGEIKGDAKGEAKGEAKGDAKGDAKGEEEIEEDKRETEECNIKKVNMGENKGVILKSENITPPLPILNYRSLKDVDSRFSRVESLIPNIKEADPVLPLTMMDEWTI